MLIEQLSHPSDHPNYIKHEDDTRMHDVVTTRSKYYNDGYHPSLIKCITNRSLPMINTGVLVRGEDQSIKNEVYEFEL